MGADGAADEHADVRGALRGHTVVVQRIGGEVVEGIGGVGDIGDGVIADEDGKTGATVGAPSEGNLFDRRRNGDIRREVAPSIGQEDVVNSHNTG